MGEGKAGHGVAPLIASLDALDGVGSPVGMQWAEAPQRELCASTGRNARPLHTCSYLRHFTLLRLLALRGLLSRRISLQKGSAAWYPTDLTYVTGTQVCAPSNRACPKGCFSQSIANANY